VTAAVIDDHLLRDLLSDEVPAGLHRVLRDYEAATTNLYYLRLCRSTAVAHGGQLTGAWPEERRKALARSLLELPEGIAILPMRTLAFRMAELAITHRVSNLGAEAVAAAEALDAPLYVWVGDDGPAIRSCATACRVRYGTIAR
jgi:hypothetical protein